MIRIMGSVEKPRISKATLDKKADSSIVSILKQSYDHLEKENKQLEEKNSKTLEKNLILWRNNRELKSELRAESKLWRELKDENKALKQENKELSDEMERIGKEARKLAFLVDKLKQAIQAEENKA